MSSDFAFSELTPVSFLRRAAAVFADRTAIVDGDFSCTYRDFWLRARQSADLLASAGVSPAIGSPSWLRTRICCSRPITLCRSVVVFWWQ